MLHKHEIGICLPDFIYYRIHHRQVKYQCPNITYIYMWLFSLRLIVTHFEFETDTQKYWNNNHQFLVVVVVITHHNNTLTYAEIERERKRVRATYHGKWLYIHNCSMFYSFLPIILPSLRSKSSQVKWNSSAQQALSNKKRQINNNIPTYTTT